METNRKDVFDFANGRNGHVDMEFDDIIDSLTAPDDPERLCVLVIEDDGPMRDLLEDVFTTRGHFVTSFADGFAASRFLALSGAPVDVIVTDIRMPRMNGLEFIAALREKDWQTPIVVVSAFAGPDQMHDYLELGATTVIGKPFSLHALGSAIDEIVAAR